jgi:hypothetical protein
LLYSFETLSHLRAHKITKILKTHFGSLFFKTVIFRGLDSVARSRST